MNDVGTNCPNGVWYGNIGLTNGVNDAPKTPAHHPVCIVIVALTMYKWGNEQMTNKRTVTSNDIVERCAICDCPIVYVNPPTIDGKSVCDTCARDRISDVMRDDTICPMGTVGNCHDCDIYDVCGESRDNTIELCDYCDNPATMECPVCNAMICDNHIKHGPYNTNTINVCDNCTTGHLCGELPKCPMDTNLDILVDEHNLTVCRVNDMTIAIAHNGSIEPTHIIRDIADMVTQFKLNHITCLTVVIAPHITYHVHPVTLSGTVWNVNVQSVPQIKSAMNQIGVKLNQSRIG